MTISITSRKLYERQITLLGEEAHARVASSKILVIGAGGLGCPALQYLASAGVGKIGILDFDIVSLSNLQRQILYSIEDVGRPKAQVAFQKLKNLAPFCDFQVYGKPLTTDNAETIISDYDLVLDCTDNFATKFLIHDVVFKLSKILIQASVYQYEGQINVFDFRSQSGPCLRCLWPLEPLDGCTGTCADVGVLGPLLGVMGSLQSSEAIKILAGLPHLKNGESLFVDLCGLSLDVRKFRQNGDCHSCVHKESRKGFAYMQISLPLNLQEFTVIDVRSKNEFDQCEVIKKLAINSLHNIPLEDVSHFMPDKNQKYLVVCAKGVRSLKACQNLRDQHDQVFSLIGGLESLF